MSSSLNFVSKVSYLIPFPCLKNNVSKTMYIIYVIYYLKLDFLGQ